MTTRLSVTWLTLACLSACSEQSPHSTHEELAAKPTGGRASLPEETGGLTASDEAGGGMHTGGQSPGSGGESTAGIDSTPEPCQGVFAAGRHSIELDVEGTTRRFLFYVPASYGGTTSLPLIFNLHPTGSNPEAHMDGTHMEAIADERGFFVASMAGVDGAWNVLRDSSRPDEVNFAEHILDWASEQVCLDESRVYSTGFSGGARTSSLLGCAMSARISGIAPVAGIRNDPPCDGAGVSVLVIHGTGDGTNFYGGCPAGDTACSRNGEWGESVEGALADWRAINDCDSEPGFEVLMNGTEHQSWSDCGKGADIEFYKVPGGAHSWELLENTTKTVVDFFLSR